MARTWAKPQLRWNCFAADEYVSICWSGTAKLYCAIPGADPHAVESNDTRTAGWDAAGNFIYPGMTNYSNLVDTIVSGFGHGVCGHGSYVEFDSNHSKGYELDAYGRPAGYSSLVKDVVFGELPSDGRYTDTFTPIVNRDYEFVDGTYSAKWVSTQPDNNDYRWYHYGYAVLSNVARASNLS